MIFGLSEVEAMSLRLPQVDGMLKGWIVRVEARKGEIELWEIFG